MMISKDFAVEKAGLIGDPVAHSLSPFLFELLGRRLKHPVAYRALEVPRKDLGSTLKRFQEEGYLGLNVTIPHKEAIVPYLGSLSAEAKAIGAVNVIRFSGRASKGHNTDAAGFQDALEEAGFEARGKDVVVFGSGGAARAVGYALGKGGVRRVRFTARNQEKAKGLAKRLERLFPKTDFRAGPVARAEMWINATPLGMDGFPNRSPAPKDMACELAFDLVYGRLTPFLRQAPSGTRAVDGLGMLVFQALRSWEFWFDPVAPERRRSLGRGILKKLRGAG